MVTIGLDGFMDDQNLLGVGIGYVDNKLKYNGVKLADNARVKTTLATIYWKNDLSKNDFIQLVGNVAEHRVSLKEQRININQGFSLAQGNTKAKSYGIEGQIGHSFTNEVIGSITPVLGLRYSHFDLNNYTDSSNALYNLIHDREKTHVTQGFAALKWSGAPLNDTLKLIPKLHGFVYHTFKTYSKSSIKILGSTDQFAITKLLLSGTSYDLGIGTNMIYNNKVEGDFFYDIGLGKRYAGHQVTLKLRIIF